MSSPISGNLEPDPKRVHLDSSLLSVVSASDSSSSDPTGPGLPRPVLPTMTPTPSPDKASAQKKKKKVSFPISPQPPGTYGHGAVEESTGHGPQRSVAVSSCLEGLIGSCSAVISDETLSFHVSVSYLSHHTIFYVEK